MRKILLFCSLFFLTVFTAKAQSVVVNEYFNASTKEDEWVELFTTENINLQGYHLKDYTTSGNPAGDLVFTNHALWSSVPAGTIIVVLGDNVAVSEDTDSSDGLIIVKGTNTTYFSGGSSKIFNIGGAADAIQITNASNVHVHGLSHGSATSGTLPAPKAHFNETSASNSGVGLLGTQSLADVGSSSKIGKITTPTLGAGNDTDNATFIASFRTLNEAPTMSFNSSNGIVENGDEIDFGIIVANEHKPIDFTITNIGEQDLEITNFTLSNGEFGMFNDLSKTTIPSLESSNFTISFDPRGAGDFTSTLSFNTNDPDQAAVSITLKGTAIDASEIMTIAQARTLNLGTVVTVGGRVTVANELGGPSYFQDGTGGLSVYYTPLHGSVQLGDSIQVTGPLDEFGTVSSGKGMLQISGDNISFKIIETERKIPAPQVLKINEIQEIHQSQLIKIENASFALTGSFQGNVNYKISDGSGTTDVRIGANTSLVGVDIPEGTTDVIAVVSRYGGAIQIFPRTPADLSVQEVEVPGSDLTADQTFDVVTWNVEWFGNAANGPSGGVDLQIQNVATVIQTMNADVYALAEISDNNAFNTLLTKLDGYRGFVAPISQTQKTAFIFKPSVVDSLHVDFISTSWSQPSSWATGRYPYEFITNVTINGETKSVYLNVIHAKALGDADSYQRRVQDSNELKSLLDQSRSNTKYILLGDFNDMVTSSTYTSTNISPYKNFVDDTENWKVLTKILEEKNQGSYKGQTMLDHIVISKNLFDDHIDGSQKIENPNYIGNYISTTSDHFPVHARFFWGDTTTTSVEFGDLNRPKAFNLEQNYPNPFNPSTTIAFTLDRAQSVSLTVYNVLGKKVQEVISGQTMTSGRHEVRFDASKLASGTYIYQIRTADGKMISKMMSLIK